MSLPKAARVQVQSYRVSNKPVTVDVSATNGAVIGTNLWDANGNLITQAEWNALGTAKSSSTSTFSGTTDDVNEGQYNLYFTDRRAQDAVGSILQNTANITLTYVGGTSIKADLTTVTLTTGGSLELLAFDSYGRLSQTAPASTSNLAEGSNLYYTNARVAAYIATVAGQPSGLATLDSGGKVPITQLPAAAISQTYVESSQAAMLALAADVGDICVRTDINETFILQALPASTLGNWVQLLFPTAGVSSFNGRTGAVNPANGDYTFSIIGGTAQPTQGGTGLTSYAIGDTIYGSNINTLSTVAGNTTTTRKFYRQTGTGTASAAPVWDTLLGKDVPVFGASGSSHAQGAVPDPGSTAGTTHFLREDGSWAIPPSGSGTVTSVQVSAPTQFNVTGGPITTSGTITLAWANQNANLVFAGPASGSAATPAFRALNAADIAPGMPPGMRNLLINAAQAINQRSYASGTATTATKQYTVDRWYVQTSGQNVSWSLDANGIPTYTAPAGGFGQVIEGSSIRGGIYVLSWTGTATATVNGTTVANGGTFTLTGNTNATVVFSGGTLKFPQLELGSVPTPFDFRPLAMENELCARYCQFITTTAGNAFVMALAYSTTNAVGFLYLPTIMRAAPTGTTSGVVTMVPPGPSTAGSGALSVTPVSNQIIALLVVLTGLTSGSSGYLAAQTNPQSILLTAEL